MSKLVKNLMLNYAHARKPLQVASPKELVLVLSKVNLRTKFIGQEMQALSSLS